MSPVVFAQGRFQPQNEVGINPFHSGLMSGHGAFEKMLCWQGRIHFLTEHCQRLSHTLSELGIASPYATVGYEEILQQLVIENDAHNTGLQAYVFPSSSNQSELFAHTFPLPAQNEKRYQKGFSAVVLTDNRWKYKYLNSISQQAELLLRQEVRAHEVDEAILVNNGFALEGLEQQLFLVRHGVLYTPPSLNSFADNPCRRLILSLAEKLDVKYRENRITERDLYQADEIFLSNLFIGLRPIVTLNNETIGEGRAGPIWQLLFPELQQVIYATNQATSHVC